MAFTVSWTALNRRADTRRIIRIDKVHVHRHVKARSAPRGPPYRFIHDGAHSPFVELTHSDDPNTGIFEGDGFLRVDAACADQHAVFRVNLRRESADLC